MGNLGSWTRVTLDTPDLTSPVTLGKSFNLCELRPSHLESWDQFSELEMLCLSHWPSGLWLILPEVTGSWGAQPWATGAQSLRALGAVNPGTLGMAALPEREGKMGGGHAFVVTLPPKGLSVGLRPERQALWGS